MICRLSPIHLICLCLQARHEDVNDLLSSFIWLFRVIWVGLVCSLLLSQRIAPLHCTVYHTFLLICIGKRYVVLANAFRLEKKKKKPVLPKFQFLVI
jgi:hypothetical protein